MVHVRSANEANSQNFKRRNEEEDFFYGTSIVPVYKTIWNPRPVIDLVTRAIWESGGSFLLVLGPTFSALLTNKALLTNAVGTYTTFMYLYRNPRQ